MNLIKDLVLLEVDTNEINRLDGLNQEVIELIRIILDLCVALSLIKILQQLGKLPKLVFIKLRPLCNITDQLI